MTEEKWEQRERKLRRKQTGMRVTGRSVFTLQEIVRRKADAARQEKDSKQKPNKAK